MQRSTKPSVTVLNGACGHDIVIGLVDSNLLGHRIGLLDYHPDSPARPHEHRGPRRVWVDRPDLRPLLRQLGHRATPPRRQAELMYLGGGILGTILIIVLILLIIGRL